MTEEQNSVDDVLPCHRRPKHHFHPYAASLGYLFWATHPFPFLRVRKPYSIDLLLHHECPLLSCFLFRLLRYPPDTPNLFQ